MEKLAVSTESLIDPVCGMKISPRKMAWGIKKEEFDNIQALPPLSEDDRSEGFFGVGLFYGFGDDR